MNDVLSSGNIPGLFQAEEQDEILNALRPAAKRAGVAEEREALWAYFINQVTRQRHPHPSPRPRPHLHPSPRLHPNPSLHPDPDLHPGPDPYQVKSNLHVLLCFSPIGDPIRVRCRRFPALVNCVVIDWFQPWPEEALHAVSLRFLKEEELGTAEAKASVIGFMP